MDEKRLKRLFNLSKEQFLKIFQFQNGRCPICNFVLKKANVDHQHDTGRINGLLCWRCNKAIGLLGNRIDRLKNAIQYLEFPPAVLALGHEVLGQIGSVTKRRRRKR